MLSRQLGFPGMEIQTGQRRLGCGLEPVLAGVVRALSLYDVEGVSVPRFVACVSLRLVINLQVCFKDMSVLRVIF